MTNEKSLIKNKVLEDIFLMVAPEEMINTYFNFFETSDPVIVERKQALATMMASKVSKAAVEQLLVHYHNTTGKHFQVYEGGK